WIRGRITEDHLAQLHHGVDTPVGRLSCAEVRICGEAGPRQRLEVTLKEGKNRHIRRLFGALRDEVHGTPLKVLELKRIRFGEIGLDVESGQWRFLTKDEI